MESYFCVKTFRCILLLKIIALQIEGSLNPVNSAELLGAAAPNSVLSSGPSSREVGLAMQVPPRPGTTSAS